MTHQIISRATLGRLPQYLEYAERLDRSKLHVSAAEVANALSLGEVQVRKDLCMITGGGKPRVGFLRSALIRDIKAALGYDKHSSAIIVGAGKLGQALLSFVGFEEYGVDIVAAFDNDEKKAGLTVSGKEILSVTQLRHYIDSHNIKLGIITVPASYAQSVCNDLVKYGIKAIWNFAPTLIEVPEDVAIKSENLALSLAHLKQQV